METKQPTNDEIKKMFEDEMKGEWVLTLDMSTGKRFFVKRGHINLPYQTAFDYWLCEGINPPGHEY